MRKDQRKPCGFAQREALGKSYDDDPRWRKVNKLRDEGKNSEANGLVMQIRMSWGLE